VWIVEPARSIGPGSRCPPLADNHYYGAGFVELVVDRAFEVLSVVDSRHVAEHPFGPNHAPRLSDKRPANPAESSRR
jgi:hypothetical protein